MWISAAMMVVETVAGWGFNSMALLSDDWHMSSHALAIGLCAFAYSRWAYELRHPDT
jgi:Co/Zn/Cd efflux system component